MEGENKTPPPLADPTHRLRIRNLAQLVTVDTKGEGTKLGRSMSNLGIIENGTIVVALDGTIEAIGTSDDLDVLYAEATFALDIDGSSKSLIPGFVDGHTHPVWSGDRVKEFALKLEGATYMQIHEMGGGINFTVRHTRESSEEELLALFLRRLDRMLRQGTTTVEAKSGYGLDTDSELKMLRVIHAANQQHAIDISATFCGAHSVPEGATAEAAADDVIDVQLPAVLAAQARGEVCVDAVDVFCEKGVFELQDSRRILAAGAAAGLALNFHGEELACLHSAEMGAELGAAAISHLEEVSDAGIAAMADGGVYAVLLPTTAHVLRLTPPPARRMIEAGVPVALGSDFNPNAHCLSMPYVMNLACITLGMTMPEALVAATINAAGSLGRSKAYGSLEVGKYADLVLIDAVSWEHIAYQMGDPPIEAVFKGGRRVFA